MISIAMYAMYFLNNTTLLAYACPHMSVGIIFSHVQRPPPLPFEICSESVLSVSEGLT